MATNTLVIRRIPLVFIFDAPESRVGKIFSRLAGGVTPAVIGTIADAAALFPALAKTNLVGSLKNKVIIPMLVNPSSLTVTKTPKVVKTLTKKGIVNQFYQSEPDSIKLSGTAGGERSFLILSQLEALLGTTETGTRNIVTMIYKFGGVFKGHIDNFSISANADTPNMFNYEFDYHFVDRNHFQLFLLSIRPGTLTEAIQNPGKAFKEDLKISASSLLNTTGISILKK